MTHSTKGEMAGPNEYADRHPQKLCTLAHRNLVLADSAENKLTKKRSFFSLMRSGSFVFHPQELACVQKALSADTLITPQVRARLASSSLEIPYS